MFVVAVRLQGPARAGGGPAPTVCGARAERGEPAAERERAVVQAAATRQSAESPAAAGASRATGAHHQGSYSMLFLGAG